MLSAQIEDLTAETLEEAKPLLPAHYDELSEHKLAGIPLDPQYGLYLARAAAGQVLYVTLREEGRLIGYLVSFVAPGMHYQTCLTATGDIFFVFPDRRGLEGGKLLFTTWVKECKRRGIRLAQIGMKTRHAKFVRPLLEAIGFVETEVMFWQFLDKE
jgi:GNAT superfamily N-acetyltransferase